MIYFSREISSSQQNFFRMLDKKIEDVSPSYAPNIITCKSKPTNYLLIIIIIATKSMTMIVIVIFYLCSDLFKGARLRFIEWNRNGSRRGTFERARPALGVSKFNSFFVLFSQSFITGHSSSTSADEVNDPVISTYKKWYMFFVVPLLVRVTRPLDSLLRLLRQCALINMTMNHEPWRRSDWSWCTVHCTVDWCDSQRMYQIR